MAGVPAFAVTLALTAAQMAATYILTPRTKQTPTDVGKFDDIRITSSEYGAFIPRIFGQARIGGNVIWTTGIKHTLYNFPTQGGKGIPQAPAERVHVYTTNLGLALCRGQMVGVKRIWADADVVSGEPDPYQVVFQAEDLTLGGTAYVVDPDPTARGEKSVAGIGNQGSGTAGTVYIDLDSNVPTPPTPESNDPEETIVATAYTRYDLILKTNGNTPTTLAFDTTAVTTTRTVNPSDTGGEWQLLSLRVKDFHSDLRIQAPDNAGFDLDQISVTRYFDVRDGFGGGRVTGITDPDLSVNKASDDLAAGFDYSPPTTEQGENQGTLPGYADFRFYTGTTLQTVNTTFTQYLDTKYGAGNGVKYAPAYRDLSYIVYSEVNLKQGRVPNFTVEVFNNTTRLNDILATFLDDVNIGAERRNFEQTETDIFGNDLELLGFVESDKATRRGLIESLERYFNFRLGEIDGKVVTLKEYPDETNYIYQIEPEELRARNYGDEGKESDYTVTLTPENELPREVRFSILNPSLDYHNETISATLYAGVSSLDAQDFSFPIVDTTERARLLAEELLLSMYTQYKRVEFTAMPSLARYSIGDNVRLDVDGTFQIVKIVKKTLQLPLGVVSVEGVIIENYRPTELQSVVTELSTLTSDQIATVTYPRQGKVVPIISRPIREADRGRLGVYVAVGNRGYGQSDNTGLYRELGEENYIIREYFDSPSVIGKSFDALGTHSVVSAEDTTNVLDIYFDNLISLESVTAGDLERYPTLNLLRIGDEWVQFRTATVQPTDASLPYLSKWRVSNLMRGRFGTEDAVGTHSTNEDIVLATNTLKFFDLDRADIGETVTLKAVAGGESLDDAQEVSFTFTPISGYSVDNPSDDREIDVDCTSVDELAKVVATIIKDTNL